MRAIFFITSLSLYVLMGFAQQSEADIKGQAEEDSVSIMWTHRNKMPSDKQLMKLAKQYRYGIMRETDPQKSVAIYGYLAKKGNIKAMTELGKCYLNGDGVEQNPSVAQKLFAKAAKSGNVSAKCHLAMIYQQGLNGRINYKKAYALYKEAADAGSAQGMYGAGYLQYKGFGVEQNYTEAVKMLEKGAAKKHPGCSLLLASYYANGYDRTQDLDRAEEYYRMASKHGNSWTVDITKNGIIDSIGRRKARQGKWTHVKNGTLKEKGMPEITQTINAKDIVGRWKGIAYYYDWSRQNIVGDQEISLEIESLDEDSIHVKYFSGDSLATAYPAILKDDAYVSKNMTSEQKEYSWTVTKTKFDLNKDKLFVEFRVINFKNMSFRKPLLAVLTRENSSCSTNADSISTFHIEKVRNMGGEIIVDIIANEDMDVETNLSSIYGITLQSLGGRHLSKGYNKLAFRTLSLQGEKAFVVNIVRNDERHSKKVTVGNNE